MYWPWIFGALIFIPAMIAWFIYFERRALRHPEKQATLSRAVFDLGRRFPLSIFGFGWITGALPAGLAVHFYWHWCPT